MLKSGADIKVRLQLLDLLRALAITLVVITHAAVWLLPGGSIGVSIFFCLSGFLIATMLLRQDMTVKEFWIRRMFRIYPAYIAVCFIHLYVLYKSGSANYLEYANGLPELLFVVKMPDRWLGMGVGVLWTLQVEIWFYMLIPIVMRLTTGINRIFFVLALIGSSFAFKFGIISRPNYSIFSMLFWMDNLLYGVLTALILHRITLASSSPKVGTTPAPAATESLSPQKLFFGRVFILTIFLLILAFSVLFSSDGTWPFQSSLVSALTAVIIYFCSKYPIISFKIPSVVTYIALISYSIYLAHPFPLDYSSLVLSTGLVASPGALKKIILLISFMGLVAFLHYMIERPGIAFGKKIVNSLSARTGR